jgi:hypothetical protein
MSDPRLAPTNRDELVKTLMAARRAVGVARRNQDKEAEDEAHGEIDRAKTALGERGPVWWDDGAPDLNRHLARTGPYANWYANLHEDER